MERLPASALPSLPSQRTCSRLTSVSPIGPSQPTTPMPGLASPTSLRPALIPPPSGSAVPQQPSEEDV